MAYPSPQTPGTYTATTGTSHSVNLPASISSGSLLLCLFASDTSSITHTGPTTLTVAWTAILADQTISVGDGITYSLWAKEAGSGEPSTMTVGTSGSTEAACQVWEIRNWYGGTPSAGTNYDIGTVSSSTGTTNTPNSVTATWGTGDNLFICLMFMGDDGDAITSWPSSYTDDQTQTIVGAGNNEQPHVAFCSRSDITTASDTPGTITMATSEAVHSFAFVVRPAAAGGGATPHGVLGLALHGPFGGPFG